MKGGFLTLALLMLPFGACREEEKRFVHPAGILPMDTTAMVLHEIHELESALLVSGIRQDSAQTLYRLRLEPALLKRYHLDTVRLNQSLRFYSSEPALLDSLYRLVMKKADPVASPVQ